MGSKDAITLIGNVRDNLSEPLSAAELLNASAGSTWTNAVLLKNLNKAKDRAWAIIKRVRENYFQTSDTLSLVAGTKEYALATNFRHLVGIKCTTGGYESLRFRRSDQMTVEFQTVDAMPQNSGNAPSEMLYDIIAQSKIKFANYPPTTLTAAYDYIKSLSDYTLSGSSTSDIDDEHTEFMEAYATYKSLLVQPSDVRIKFWLTEIQRLEKVVEDSARQRNQRESRRIEAWSI